jgi:hypothetical protein
MVQIKSSNNTQKFYSNWEMKKHGVPHGSFLVPLLFISHVNDLPPIIRTLSKPIIFADDTSFIFSSKKFVDFHTMTNIVLSQRSK